ncbi:hypothetical protein [Reichenbachiella sp. MALMAid0571]|uniref:hypothetical protein n=1 Tax=Reichenbachiella sp. MALMAid0571 TaxID=3143939 RepID=UPI0032DF2E59
MARIKKISVRHFLNKRLPPQKFDNNVLRYPLYIRLRYNNKPVEVRSILASISWHLDSQDHKIYSFYSEVDFWDKGYFTEEEFDNLSERLKTNLQKEISGCEWLFYHYLNKNINILDYDTKRILEIFLRPTFLALEDYLKILLASTLNETIYKPFSSWLIAPKIEFSKVFMMLKQISNDGINSTNFYRKIIKPYEEHNILLEDVYENFTKRNLSLLYECMFKDDSNIHQHIDANYAKLTAQQYRTILKLTGDFYYRQLGFML